MPTYLFSQLAWKTLLLFVFLWSANEAFAVNEFDTVGPLYPPTPQTDVRYDGVLAESYQYHHSGGSVAGCATSGGWYGYGFPVSSYRWGWFGAERYYPRVVWHNDNQGHCVRWSYRQGY